MEDFIRIVIYGILFLALIALVIFVYLYATGSPWRLTVLGRNLMYQKIVLAAVLLSSFSRLVFGRYPGFLFIEFGVYLLVLFSFVNDVVQLAKIQRRVPEIRARLQEIRARLQAKRKTRQRV